MHPFCPKLIDLLPLRVIMMIHSRDNLMHSSNRSPGSCAEDWGCSAVGVLWICLPSEADVSRQHTRPPAHNPQPDDDGDGRPQTTAPAPQTDSTQQPQTRWRAAFQQHQTRPASETGRPDHPAAPQPPPAPSSSDQPSHPTADDGRPDDAAQQQQVTW